MAPKIAIKCLCGEEVELEVIGGQYQDDYRGDCKCGRKWILSETTESSEEIFDAK